MNIKNEEYLIQEFENECEIIEMRYEYPGYTGVEKYGIITSLSENEFEKKYSEILNRYKPYITLKADFGIERRRFIRNEKKAYMRLLRGDIYSVEDIELHHPEITKNLLDVSLEQYGNYDLLYKAISILTPIQKRRIAKYFFCGKTYSEIALEEGVNVSKIYKSVELGLKKIKKFLDEGENLASPSGNK